MQLGNFYLAVIILDKPQPHLSKYTHNCVTTYNEAHICPLNLYIPSNNLVDIVLPINVGQILSSNAVIIAQLVGWKINIDIHSLIRVRAREIRTILHII